ncbi:Tripartite-type tricarboxylate transporter, receptor component TctC [Polaromonas sp. OV174]|nr:Tripartite-type tricarboxylate transporter, receptor component TctC [Polaromonas sp. OV174]
MMCRTVAERLATVVKQPVVVENKVGASGTIGSAYVAKSAADGYTILCANNSDLTLAQFIIPKLSYSPEKDFLPLVMAVKQTVFLVGNAAVPATDAAQLIELSKKSPLAYANPGLGSNTTLAMEMFNAASKANFISVPYTGVALTDVISGQVPLTVFNLAPLLPHIKAGKLKPYVVFQSERHPSFPDIPTAREAVGVDVVAASWFGFFAPVGTPQGITRQLEQGIRTVLADPATVAVLSKAEMQIVGMPSTDFSKVIVAERAYHQRLVQRFNAAK